VILENGKVVFNHSVDEVTDAVAMGVTSEEPQNAIYTEKTLGGYAAVAPRGDSPASRVDLELLFNAVTAGPAELNALFAKEEVR
jgi:ABC-2 type transport system ATP-binding protein